MDKRLHVLILEDRPADAELMVAELRKEGFETEWRRVDCEQAFAEGLLAAPDVILSDHALPQYDSVRALECFQQSGLDIPFIIVSGRIGEELAVEQLKRGASDYVWKDRLGRLGPAVTHALEEKRVRAERRAAEVQLRLQAAALQSASNGILITDRGGTIAWANDAMTRMTGYAAEELIGHNPRLLKSGQQNELIYHQMWDTILSARVWHGEIVNRRKDGSLYPEEMTITPVCSNGAGVTHFVAIKQDISERKETIAKLQQFNAELEQRVRDRTARLDAANKELEAFAYSVSHDLRAPLRAIDGFTQVLLEDQIEHLNAEGQDCLRRVRAASQRMGRLIDDILELSRLSRYTLTCTTVDLTALAQHVVNDLRAGQRDRQVEVTIAPGLSACGDSRLLEVVLMNLLGNAWKFTGKTEQAHIEFGVTDQATPPGAVASNGAAKTQVFFVRDNGAGFDMALSSRLFGAFQRLHNQAEFAGNGIGLATVQRIIHRHGGKVWAEGAVGKGATLFFTLGAEPEGEQ